MLYNSLRRSGSITTVHKISTISVRNALTDATRTDLIHLKTPQLCLP